MQDRRLAILEAALATLREHGYAGFTQQRIAARAGLRQSHITYYHPTRLDLLEAVAQAAVERQLAAVAAIMAGVTTAEDLARRIADLVGRHDNTRVLMALAQAADEEPRLRDRFRELADGIATHLTACLGRLRGEPVEEAAARSVHATAVGLAVIDLATGWPDGAQRAAAVLASTLQPITQAGTPGNPVRRGRRARSTGGPSA